MRKRYFSPQGKIEILLSRGDVLNLIGETARAQKDAGEALEVSRQANLPRAQAECLIMMANVHDQLGEMAAMRQDALMALDLYRKTSDLHGEGTALNLLAIAVEFTDGPEASIPYYEQALEVVRTIGNRGEETTILQNLGWVYSKIGEYEKAQRYLEEGLEVARIQEDPRLEAGGHHFMGVLHYRMGRPSDALPFHQHAQRIRQRIGDKWFESITWSWIGHDWQDMGNLPQAREAYARSLALDRSAGNVSSSVTGLLALGVVLLNLGDLNSALASFQESRALAEQLGQAGQIADVWAHLSKAYFFLGEWSHAEAAAQTALSGFPSPQTKPLAALILAQQALVQGDRLLAYGLLKEAGEAAADSPDPAHRFDVQASWAEFHLDIRDASTARKPLEAMHGLLPGQRGKDAAPRLEVLAACLLACEGDAGEAETVFAHALSPLQKMGLRWEEARSLLRFGRALGREKGRSYLQTAQALFSEAGAAGWAALCDQALKS
jgi:tetratricopeptide (TPR) repeat protein